MGHIILRQQQLVIEIRREIGVVPRAVFLQFIRVAVDEFQTRIGHHLPGDHVERVRCKHIVMIQEHHPAIFGQRQRIIAGFADMPVLVPIGHFDTVIAAGVIFQHLADVRIG